MRRRLRYRWQYLSIGFSALALAGCEGCGKESSAPAGAELANILASGVSARTAAPRASSSSKASELGHPANVLPGQGPRRIPFDGIRSGPMLPILPGQGIGPIRIGANVKTIERLMGAPCDEQTEATCLYVGRATKFELDGGVTKAITVSRKGRTAKRAADGAIVEYGFFNGALSPDVYFGMLPKAVSEIMGEPQRIEQVAPLGEDGLAERHFYDGVTFEYDRWSNGNLVLGAATITKSDTAAAKTAEREKVLAERAAQAAAEARRTRPTVKPR
jgi:hypothetical protein